MGADRRQVPKKSTIVIFRRLNLYSFKLSDPVPRIIPKGDYQLLLERESIPQLTQAYSPELVHSRFSRGDLCCCALHKSDVVSYCWVVSHRELVGEIERVVKLGEGEIYLFDAFTSPPHRGRNLFPAILSKSLKWAKSQAYSRALIFALTNNRPSIRAINKAGFRLFQTVTFIKFFGRTTCWLGRRRKGEEAVHLERR